MPIGPGLPSLPWTYQSIVANAPHASGVYAIFNAQRYIYVGESGDIQARLLQHYNGDNQCIINALPTGFAFEVVAANQRVARQNQLIVALTPACNQKLG